MITIVRRILEGWSNWLANRVAIRARAAAARAIAAEIAKVREQRTRAEQQHRPVRQIDNRLRTLMNTRLQLELGR